MDLTPATLKEYSPAELSALADTIRGQILDAVSRNGGHLASNLGMVEATLALHRVFTFPSDTLVFDVGHQCYTHKILTGRGEAMDTLRRPGGLSGFPNREESDADPFTSGHSGTSLSAAVGIARGNLLAGRDAFTVAVIGDGSFANGMIYEALNDCAVKGLRLILLLNDNEMSISKNEGALSDYFAKIRTSRTYFAFKHGVKRFCGHIPLLGRPAVRFAIVVKEFIKRVLNKKNVFENFGLEYLGPINGHDIATLEAVLTEAKACDVPCVVHMITQKGRGYPPAEAAPTLYHAVPPFSPEVGVCPPAETDFSKAFGAALSSLAEEDCRLCAVTAAMAEGTGLREFQKAFPKRFFDVGIAEEHAVTMAAGLARSGFRPVVALYSTFAQRVFDQVLHDGALQKLPLVLALDRSGVIPGDGVTHQGLFDVALFSPIPGVSVYAPIAYDEFRPLLQAALERDAVTVIRYPRGKMTPVHVPLATSESGATALYKAGRGQRILLITYGKETHEALAAAARLCERYAVTVLRLCRITPLPQEEILAAAREQDAILVAEEAMVRGGVGEAIGALFAGAGLSCPFAHVGVTDFVPHGVTVDALSLDGASLARRAEALLQK